MSTWPSFREKLLSDPRVKKEYNDLLPVQIAAQIIEIRKVHNLSQAELAKLAGTSQPAVARLESGSYEGYSMKTLRKIAAVFGMTLDIIFRKSA